VEDEWRLREPRDRQVISRYDDTRGIWMAFCGTGDEAMTEKKRHEDESSDE
jgi:hypothetical protein